MGMNMVGNGMGKFMQYQTAQAIPKFAEGGSGIAGDVMCLGAGVALGQVFCAKPAGRFANAICAGRASGPECES